MRQSSLLAVFVSALTATILNSCESKSPRESLEPIGQRVDYRAGFLNFTWGQSLAAFEQSVKSDTLMELASVIRDSTNRITCSVTVDSKNFYFLFLERRFFAVDYFVRKNDIHEITEMVRNLTASYGKPDSSGDGNLKSLRWRLRNEKENEIDIFIRETSTTFSVEVQNASLAQTSKGM